MTSLDDDDARRLFEQTQDDQKSAGLAHIADSVAEFRRGFSPKEAFKLCREFLIELMAKTGSDDEDEDEE